jgi:copper chaperone CopZ
LAAYILLLSLGIYTISRNIKERRITLAQELTLYVKEATDRGTIQNLESILTNLNGVERALVDTDDGEVKITYDANQISRQEVEKNIQQNGYHVT